MGLLVLSRPSSLPVLFALVGGVCLGALLRSSAPHHDDPWMHPTFAANSLIVGSVMEAWGHGVLSPSLGPTSPRNMGGETGQMAEIKCRFTEDVTIDASAPMTNLDATRAYTVRARANAPPGLLCAHTQRACC